MTERVIGHMVVRNEIDRRLMNSVSWLMAEADQLVVYDDRSDDATFEWLVGMQATGIPLTVGQRAAHDPSFLDDESAFREAAWRFMEATAKPTEDDWILCLDADERLVERRVAPGPAFVRHWLLDDDACKRGGAVTFHVAEIFDVVDVRVLDVRIDGFWGQIEACRYVRWRPNGHFAPRHQGGGSIPAGWADTAVTVEDPVILHYGYCDERDRQAKYERYRNTTGHNPVHIESILTSPILQRIYL